MPLYKLHDIVIAVINNITLLCSVLYQKNEVDRLNLQQLYVGRMRSLEDALNSNVSVNAVLITT